MMAKARTSKLWGGMVVVLMGMRLIVNANVCKSDDLYMVVDDMESYTPWAIPGNNIWDVWRDGEGNCVEGNGNNSGAVLAETPTPVLGGVQSMKYDYDNDGTIHNPCTEVQDPGHDLYSKIEAQVAGLTSGIGTDWTIGGVKVLSLNFCGTVRNSTTDPLWVQLQDNTKGYGDKVFYGANAGESLLDFTVPAWHNWCIDLADFNVDLTNVVSIVIGIGNEFKGTAFGSGTLYFDDILLLLSPIVVRAGAVIYVDGDSAGGDGSNWAAAFEYLQDALAAANVNDEIRVAQGTYVPDQNSVNPAGSGDRTATFQLISGVAIYGGYAGYGEADPNVRDVRGYETILCGDLLGNDFAEALPAEYGTDRTRGENSYSVVAADGTDVTAVLDGFTITAGQADSTDGQYGRGGGMYNFVGSPTLVNCTFTRNWARFGAGAIYNHGGSLVAFKCRFMGNAAGGSGGAVRAGTAAFINCSFTGNHSTSQRGRGGAIFSRETITMTNCTFCGNSAVDGGAVGIYYGDAIILTNCIFWGNWDEGGTDESAQVYSHEATIDVSFCCIQGWTGDLGGVGNTGDEPLLADADGSDNLFGTIDDYPRLLPGSAALNAGDNGFVPGGLISDLDGNPRIADGTVDMGVYEGVTQAILLTTESLTVPEGGAASFGVSLARAPEENLEVSVVFGSGDTDVSVADGITFVFDSGNYSTPRMVSVSAAEDADYLHGTALILAHDDDLRSAGVTVREQDNEPTTGIVYVDDDSVGLGDGMTWPGAYKSLQDALHTALWNPQVWEIRVGQGIYKPDEGARMVADDRIASFHLKNSTAVKGGYAGLGAADPDARDVKLYQTILSGDLNGDDDGFANNEENSCHIVYTGGTNETAVLDGLTITAGNADGASYAGQLSGGGMYNSGGAPTVIDCKITGNSAAYMGGGMCNHVGGPSLTGCTLSNNFSGADGGAIHNHHTGSVLTNCTIIDNIALGNGGGIVGDDLWLADMVLANCTIIGNEAYDYGGGISSGRLVLTNCIFWDNIAYEGPQITGWGALHHNCIQGGRLDIAGGGESDWGSGNIDVDPCFADALSGDYHLKSEVGRWDPNEGRWTRDGVTSPCIDAGDPNSDWVAELWPHGKCVNMGAFGGAPQASMSESSLGNKADINNNGSVDFKDFAGIGNSLGEKGPLRAEDLNRDAIVNFFDILQFVEEWQWQDI